MFRTLATVAVFCLALPAWADDPPASDRQPVPELKTQRDKASYAVGADIGRRLKQQGLDVDPALFARGIIDALGGEKMLLSEEECRDVLVAAQKEMQAKMAARFKDMAAKNKAAGDEFLAENKKKEGVVVLESGLQYKVLKDGSGLKPKATDTIRAHYRGTFVDGSEFDSSIGGEPLEIPVRGVIPGWTEALQLMKVGSKWELVIPPDLAYGEQGNPNIPPNSTLVFTVELISIN